MLSNETESLCLFETPYFRVCQDAGYYVIKERALINGVVVVPVFEDSSMLILKHYRPAIKMESLEFPRGAIDENESVIQAALRELKEETGLIGYDPVDVGRIHSNTSLLQSQVAVVAVSVKMPENGWAGLDALETDGESYFRVRVTPEEFKGMVSGGKITDSHTLSGFFLSISAGCQLGE